MRPFYVYILKCFDGFYYVGHTDDIEKRISMHNEGKVSNFTQKRLPVEVVFVQDFATRGEAIEMERRVKGWSRKKKEALIEKNWDELIRLSNIKKQVSNPSTSSGRTERGLSAAFTPESIEGSGRTERGLSAAFTPESIEGSGRTKRERTWIKMERDGYSTD